MEDTEKIPATSARWSAIIFALLFPTLVTWIYFIALHGTPAWLQQSAYSLGKGIQFLFPLAWVFVLRRVCCGRVHEVHQQQLDAPHEHQRTSYTLQKSLALGIAFGLLVMLAGAALYYGYLRPAGLFDSAAKEVREKIEGMGLASLPVYLAMAIFYSLIHSLLEEYYWRWFVFGELLTVARPTTAIVVSSVGFMAHHVLVLATFFGWDSPATYLFSVAVMIGGLAWAWLYWRSGTLLAPWISHALVDALIFLIGFDLLRS